MKIIWTFNPFEKNAELHQLGAKVINGWFNKKDLIEVVYVASNKEVELSTAYNIPFQKRYSTYPKKLIAENLKKLVISTKKITIFFDKSLSLSSAVGMIVDYSKKWNIDLIIIASNSKKKLPRVIFGSFAETIVHISKCDLLIYHQKTKVKSLPPKNITYAHDFSNKGEIGLVRLMDYIKKWDSFLTVVHVPIPEPEVELHDFKISTEINRKKIEKILIDNKINFKFIVEYKILPISETVIHSAKKNDCDLIAVSAQANKLSAFLGGSITRQVLRESHLPTLVLKV